MQDRGGTQGKMIQNLRVADCNAGCMQDRSDAGQK